MNSLHVLQVVNLVYLDGDLFLLDKPEKFLGVVGKFFARADVAKDLRSEELDAFRCEFAIAVMDSA
jgi:hypothetical protein